MIIYRQPIDRGGAGGANRAFYGDKQTFIYTYATSRLAAEHKRDRVAPSLRACSLLGGAFQPGRNGEGRLILSHESEGLHPSGGPPTNFFIIIIIKTIYPHLIDRGGAERAHEFHIDWIFTRTRPRVYEEMWAYSLFYGVYE
jgi:hypothetical protein